MKYTFISLTILLMFIGCRDQKIQSKRTGKEINIDEEDIENRILSLMGDIDEFLADLEGDKVEFSKIVKKWNRDEIITHFMPLLHLSNRGEVMMEQEDFFKEIFISRKN